MFFIHISKLNFLYLTVLLTVFLNSISVFCKNLFLFQGDVMERRPLANLKNSEAKNRKILPSILSAAFVVMGGDFSTVLAKSSIDVASESNGYLPYLQIEGSRLFNISSYRAAVAGDLFIPVWQNHYGIIFTDMRVYDPAGRPFEGNVQLGYRHLSSDEQCLYGIYGSFDRKKSALGNYFNQITLGGEYWMGRWFIGGNIYQPIGIHGREITSSAINGDWVTRDKKYEKAVPGIDAEVGYDFTDSITGYVGGYYYHDGDIGTKYGPKARLSYDWSLDKGRILGVFDKIGFEAGIQRDKPQGTIWYLSTNVRIGWMPKDRSVLQGVVRHMVDPLRRDPNIIIMDSKETEKENRTEQELPNLPPPEGGGGSPSGLAPVFLSSALPSSSMQDMDESSEKAIPSNDYSSKKETPTNGVGVAEDAVFKTNNASGASGSPYSPAIATASNSAPHVAMLSMLDTMHAGSQSVLVRESSLAVDSAASTLSGPSSIQSSKSLGHLPSAAGVSEDAAILSGQQSSPMVLPKKQDTLPVTIMSLTGDNLREDGTQTQHREHVDTDSQKLVANIAPIPSIVNASATPSQSISDRQELVVPVSENVPPKNMDGMANGNAVVVSDRGNLDTETVSKNTDGLDEYCGFVITPNPVEPTIKQHSALRIDEKYGKHIAEVSGTENSNEAPTIQPLTPSKQVVRGREATKGLSVQVPAAKQTLVANEATSPVPELSPAITPSSGDGVITPEAKRIGGLGIVMKRSSSMQLSGAGMISPEKKSPTKPLQLIDDKK